MCLDFFITIGAPEKHYFEREVLISERNCEIVATDCFMQVSAGLTSNNFADNISFKEAAVYFIV